MLFQLRFGSIKSPTLILLFSLAGLPACLHNRIILIITIISRIIMKIDTGRVFVDCIFIFLNDCFVYSLSLLLLLFCLGLFSVLHTQSHVYVYIVSQSVIIKFFARSDSSRKIWKIHMMYILIFRLFFSFICNASSNLF